VPNWERFLTCLAWLSDNKTLDRLTIYYSKNVAPYCLATSLRKVSFKKMRPKPSGSKARLSIAEEVDTREKTEEMEHATIPQGSVERDDPDEEKDIGADDDEGKHIGADDDDDKKLPATVKLASQPTRQSDNETKEDGKNDEAMLHMQTTPVPMQPSGLDVIADVASNVDVSVSDGGLPNSVEIIVIDDVPEVRAVSGSTIEASVYSYKGVQEFYAPPEPFGTNTLQAKQVVQQNALAKRKLVKTFAKSFENGFMEMPLIHFRNWFYGLRFTKAVLNPKENKTTVWHYRVIAIDPTCNEGIKKNSPAIATNLPKFQMIATSFYETLFESSKEISTKIERAVFNDKTIMIVAVRSPPTAKVEPTFCAYKKKLIVVAAVSYQTYKNNHSASSQIDVFVSLLGVASHAVPHPTAIHSWRRNGIGLHLLIQVIKRCAFMTKNAAQIGVFLQCQEAASLHFYSMIGFHKISSHSGDGFELLPMHMQLELKSLRPESPGYNSAFMFYEEGVDVCPAFLMHLRSGALRHNLEDADLDDASRRVLFWCRYPPPRLQDGTRLEYTPKDLHDAFLGLPLLQDLKPELKEFSTLLPAASLPIKGELLLGHRIEHSKAKGTRWMATGEQDLVLSILSSDGRYEDLAFILSHTDSVKVRECHNLHSRYQQMLNFIAVHEETPSAELDKLITKQFKSSKHQIQTDYHGHTRDLLKKVIVPNLGLLEKKVQVFPSNVTDAHWTVTFVFNASYIQHDIDAEVDCGWLQPCFFRYCSIVTDGSRHTVTEEGIPWFLNFVYSYELHERTKKNATDSMKWYEPYGRSSEKRLLGTRNFPALRLNDRNHLPHQEDGFNCGVGSCAGIAIVLRNIQKHENPAFSFDSTFKRDRDNAFLKDEKTHELYMMFPEDFFEPIPAKKDLVWGNYLDLLREEIFVLFDRLATLQYTVLPQRINRQNSVDPVYDLTLKALLWPNKED
jgi:hypothetical protein